jgi:uncharacterized membrane protein HdeD (DUF308 family)
MRQHSTDWWSLVFGSLFVIIAGAVLIAMETDDLLDLRWLLPLVAIVGGVGIIAGAIGASGRKPEIEAPAPPEALAELDEDVPSQY